MIKPCKIYCYVFFSAVIMMSCTKKSVPLEKPVQRSYAIALHGGAGALPKGSYTPEQEAAYTAKMIEALKLGEEMLKRGDSATDVVVAVIKIMEDSPLFNAGKGSVFTYDGKNKMDASVMDGRTLDAGAVTNVGVIKNPITAAREVMRTKYVLFSGEGAEQFASEKGLEIVDPSYFFTDYQFKRWMQTKDTAGADKKMIDSIKRNQEITLEDKLIVEKNFGTVGCAVLDTYGNLAAGTSTGGLMNKKYDRIGDSPIIGAGTYANNNTCAVSCTGTGEDFIRMVAANTASNLMEFEHYSLQQAIDTVIQKRFQQIKGDGGMIAVDHYGNIGFSYNSDGMFRGSVNDKGEIFTAIYK